MLDTSRELYEYVASGKKNKDGITLKALREQEEQKQKDSRPPWRSTGVSNVPSWNKPSKYQLNSNIKAKVYTGLNEPKSTSSKAKNQNESESFTTAAETQQKDQLEADDNEKQMLYQMMLGSL